MAGRRLQAKIQKYSNICVSSRSGTLRRLQLLLNELSHTYTPTEKLVKAVLIVLDKPILTRISAINSFCDPCTSLPYHLHQPTTQPRPSTLAAIFRGYIGRHLGFRRTLSMQLLVSRHSFRPDALSWEASIALKVA